MPKSCGICGRKLNQNDDRLSIDCGGDCWDCIGKIEADSGNVEAMAQVRKEFALGLRPDWVDLNSEADITKKGR